SRHGSEILERGRDGTTTQHLCTPLHRNICKHFQRVELFMRIVVVEVVRKTAFWPHGRPDGREFGVKHPRGRKHSTQIREYFLSVREVFQHMIDENHVELSASNNACCSRLEVAHMKLVAWAPCCGLIHNIQA